MNTLANEKRYKACYLTKYHDCIKPQWYVHTVLLICQPLVSALLAQNGIRHVKIAINFWSEMCYKGEKKITVAATTKYQQKVFQFPN